MVVADACAVGLLGSGISRLMTGDVAGVFWDAGEDDGVGVFPFAGGNLVRVVLARRSTHGHHVISESKDLTYTRRRAAFVLGCGTEAD